MPVNSEIATEQWLRFQYVRDRGHLDFITKADRCEKFFAGDQWADADLKRLQEQKRPALTINKIISTVSTILGEQIENRAEVLFRPSAGSPAEVAEALSKVWTQVSQNNQLPWIRSDVFCDGIVRSRGFFDVRMGFDDAMQGEVKITLLNSKNVVVDPDAEEYDPDYWHDLFITKWLTGQDIATLYNQDDADYLSNREGSFYPYGYDSLERTRDRFGGLLPLAGYYDTLDKNNVRRNVRVLERQYRKLDRQEHFIDTTTGDMRPVPSDWDRNRIAALLEKTAGRLAVMPKLIKRIRWTVTADNVVLHDDWSPYKHFTVVPYFPYFRYGKTVGIVENLLGPQEILNKVSSQELHIVNTTANSGWIVEEGSLMNMAVEELEQKGAQTGLIIEYNKGAQPPEKIQPNQTPTGLDRISYKAEEHIKSISNVSDSMQGFDREDVAAKAIAYKQQRSSVNLSKAMDNLLRTDYILARNVLDLVQQYYTEPRLLTITHDDVTREPEQIAVNQPDPVTGEITNDLTLGEYSIVVTSTPHRASLEDSQFEQARALREIGVQIPDSVLIENSRLMRRAEIVKMMEGDKNSPEAQEQAALQKRAQEAEVANAEADATLKNAKATKEMKDDSQSEMQKAMAELQMERERMDMELQKMREELEMKWQEMTMKLQAKQEEHQQSMAIRSQEAAQNAQIRDEDAAVRRAQMLSAEDEEPTSGNTENKEM